ncbi:hypothetical protein VNO77_22609 [Canavalia gladiata]|uniref:Uncharacterized protein n=1 Tax=Canavalia gladiata TaxID=3824 RepID=A0AAN9L2W9_CANGL
MSSTVSKVLLTENANSISNCSLQGPKSSLFETIRGPYLLKRPLEPATLLHKFLINRFLAMENYGKEGSIPLNLEAEKKMNQHVEVQNRKLRTDHITWICIMLQIDASNTGIITEPKEGTELI